MKAIRIHEDGGPDVLRYEDAPDPVPGTGQVLIDLRAASLNHLDVWIRRGLPSVPKPRILGADGAGVVVSGDGFTPGDRVVINPGLDHGDGTIAVVGEHTDGTHAERIAVPAEQVYPIPDSLDFETAAAFPLVFETAYRMLATKAGLREGDVIIAFGENPTATIDDLHRLLTEDQVGRSSELVVIRMTEKLALTVVPILAREQ